MAGPDYSAADVPVRSDLQESHRFILDRLSSPGTWWSGAERIAIAEETLAAADCGLCRERKAALSPAAGSGDHAGPGSLPPAVVDLIHRVRSDPARLSKGWFESVVGDDLEIEPYVELIGVVTVTAGMHYFARALGIPPFELPAPKPGEPSRYRPASAKPGPAWVPMIDPAEAAGDEADLYGDAAFIPNIIRALSLVPDQVRMLRALSRTHYFDVDVLSDPTARRDLDRPQIELIAARISAINECFY